MSSWIENPSFELAFGEDHTAVLEREAGEITGLFRDIEASTRWKVEVTFEEQPRGIRVTKGYLRMHSSDDQTPFRTGGYHFGVSDLAFGGLLPSPLDGKVTLISDPLIDTKVTTRAEDGTIYQDATWGVSVEFDFQRFTQTQQIPVLFTLTSARHAPGIIKLLLHLRPVSGAASNTRERATYELAYEGHEDGPVTMTLRQLRIKNLKSGPLRVISRIDSETGQRLRRIFDGLRDPSFNDEFYGSHKFFPKPKVRRLRTEIDNDRISKEAHLYYLDAALSKAVEVACSDAPDDPTIPSLMMMQRIREQIRSRVNSGDKRDIYYGYRQFCSSSSVDELREMSLHETSYGDFALDLDEDGATTDFGEIDDEWQREDGDSAESERGFTFDDLPEALRVNRNQINNMIRQGKERWAIEIVILNGGPVSQNDLTDILFFLRHPERKGRRLSMRRGDRNLRRAWIGIRDQIVKPAIRRVLRLCQKTKFR